MAVVIRAGDIFNIREVHDQLGYRTERSDGYNFSPMKVQYSDKSIGPLDLSRSYLMDSDYVISRVAQVEGPRDVGETPWFREVAYAIKYKDGQAVRDAWVITFPTFQLESFSPIGHDVEVATIAATIDELAHKIVQNQPLPLWGYGELATVVSELTAVARHQKRDVEPKRDPILANPSMIRPRRLTRD